MGAPRAGRAGVPLLALLAYPAGMGTLAAFVLFVAPWPLLPWHVDAGGRAATTGEALATDVALLLAFGLQHSLMARRAFRDRLSPALARALYVAASALALGLLMALWKPLPEPVWRIGQPWVHGLLVALFVAGWALSVYATFAIDHFELFGLRQAWRHWRGVPEPPPVFREPSLYRRVRHPMQLGVLIGLWATPTMSAGHLLLAAGMTVHVLVGVRLEERDLERELGPVYADYRRRVPRLIPLRRPR